MENVLGYYIINDGWSGDKEHVFLVYDPATTLTYEVHPQWGFYRSSLPPCVDDKEAMWLIENHPVHKSRYTTAN